MAMIMKTIQAYAILPKTKKKSAKRYSKTKRIVNMKNSEFDMYEVTCMSSKTMGDERSYHVRVGVARR
jgi:hypothetical protein